MSIADKRICSVVKESLDQADLKAHLQAYVKYAGKKNQISEKSSSTYLHSPRLERRYGAGFREVSPWQEAVHSWTKESVGSENTTSEFPARHRNSLLKPSQS
jgi:hypothetical protein